MKATRGRCLTAGAVRRALADLPEEAEVVAYADWVGVGERPFGLLDEQMHVCGYFSIVAVERDENPCSGVIVLGDAVM